MTADTLVQTLGKADFAKEKGDGSTIYEWGLLSSGDLPDAVLWAVVDDHAIVVKVGTDAELYQTSSGLHVGIFAGEFAKHYGSPVNNPGPGLYVFSQGVGIAVESHGNVVAIWTEPGASPWAGRQLPDRLDVRQCAQECKHRGIVRVTFPSGGRPMRLPVYVITYECRKCGTPYTGEWNPNRPGHVEPATACPFCGSPVRVFRGVGELPETAKGTERVARPRLEAEMSLAGATRRGAA